MIDCLPNLEPDEAARVEAFIAILRRKYPATPVLLVENLAYPDGIFPAERRERHLASNRVLREIHARLRGADPNLHYLKSDSLLGHDNEATVDGAAIRRILVSPVLPTK